MYVCTTGTYSRQPHVPTSARQKQPRDWMHIESLHRNAGPQSFGWCVRQSTRSRTLVDREGTYHRSCPQVTCLSSVEEREKQKSGREFAAKGAASYPWKQNNN